MSPVLPPACEHLVFGARPGEVRVVASTGERTVVAALDRGSGSLPVSSWRLAEVDASCHYTALDFTVTGYGFARTALVGIRSDGIADPAAIARLRAATGFDGPAADPTNPADGAQFAVRAPPVSGNDAERRLGDPIDLVLRPGPPVPQRTVWRPTDSCAGCFVVLRGEEIVAEAPEGTDVASYRFWSDRGPDRRVFLTREQGGLHTWIAADAGDTLLALAGDTAFFGRDGSGCVTVVGVHAMRLVCLPDGDWEATSKGLVDGAGPGVTWTELAAAAALPASGAAP